MRYVLPVILVVLSVIPAPARAEAAIAPQVPVFIDAKAPHEGETLYFGGQFVLYSLLAPETGAVAAASFTYEPKPFTALSAALGMGVRADAVYPSLTLRASTVIEPVLLWSQVEYDLLAVDALAMAEIFYTKYSTVGVEGEVLRDWEADLTWYAAGPDMLFLPNDRVWFGLAWLFSPAPSGTVHVPRLYVLLNF